VDDFGEVRVGTDFGESRLAQMQATISKLHTELDAVADDDQPQRQALTDQILQEAVQLVELEDRIRAAAKAEQETARAAQEKAVAEAQRRVQDQARVWAVGTGVSACVVGVVFFLADLFVDWMSEWSLLLYLVVAAAGVVLARKPMPIGAENEILSAWLGAGGVAVASVLAALFSITALPGTVRLWFCGLVVVCCVGGVTSRLFVTSGDQNSTESAAPGDGFRS
jgi:hypothetical protein